ncbi:MAG: DUF6049 family protein [archaeon]|nr:DUF6049 family protein [archaeon]
MNSILRVFLGFVLLVLLSTTVSAVTCNFDAVINTADIRSDSDLTWSSSVDAELDDYIDIQTNVSLNRVSGDAGCNAAYVDAKADIFGYRNGNWEFIKTTQTITEQVFYLDNETLPAWFNAFQVDGVYEKYRIDVFVREMNSGSWDDSQSIFAFVNDFSDGACNDIDFISRTVTMNENDSTTETFSIENNSDSRFNITQVDAYDNSSIVTVDETNFDTSIASNSSANVDIDIDSSSVSSTQNATGFVKISGEFANGRTCSFSDIGTESFPIRVLNSGDSGSGTCSSIDLRLTNVTIDEDSTDTFDFTIDNPTDSTFIVDNIDLVESSQYFDVEEVFHDSFINQFDDGQLRIRVNSNAISGDRTGTVSVRVTGRFSGGDSCTASEVGIESFTVNVEEGSNNAACTDIKINTRNVSIDEDSTDFQTFTISNRNDSRFILTDVQAVSNNSALVDVDVDSFDEISDNDDASNVELRFNSSNVSSNKSTTAYLKATGYFENGQTCSFSSIAQPVYTITVRNTDDSDGSVCANIDVSSKTVRVQEGQEEFESFTINNRTNRNFIIDNVTVSDSDNAFTSSAYQWDDRVNANNSGTITARIKANTVSQEEVGDARIQIRGHFTNGTTCSSSQVGTVSFSVIVENSGSTGGSSGNSCDDFELSVPNFEKVSGRETINVAVNNPLSRTGTIKLSGNNLSISPTTISIPANSYFTKDIDVELLSGTRSFLVYDVDLRNCNVLSKTTEIISSELSGDFEIVSFPSIKNISGEGTIPVTVQNNSDSQQQVEVFLEALPSSISSSKETLNIPAGSSRTAQINVSGNVSGDYPAKLIVQVDNAKEERDLTVRFSGSNSGNVRANVTASNASITNTYDVLVKLTSNSSDSVNGTIELNVPDGWNVSGNNQFDLAARENDTFTFNITPNRTLSESETISINVFFDGQQLSEAVELQPATNPIGTAFAVLGNSWVNLVLVIIIILLIYALWKRNSN